MPELTLWEALCDCAPMIGDHAVDDRRARAMELVYGELQDIVRRRSCDNDLASKVFIRLVESGPGPHRATNDSEARGYLSRAITNGQKDQWRAAKLVAELPDHLSTHDTPHRQLQGMEEELAEQAAAAEAWGDLDAIAKQTAATLRSDARDQFLDDIAVRRRVALRETTCHEEVQNRHGHVDSKTRNRFDKAQSRAMMRLALGAERANLPEPRRSRLKRLVDALKRHEASWTSPGAADERR
jgi:hypothetical protein